MHQIHDKGYRRLFKNKGIFRQLLETFVAKGWVKDLDFSTCETLDKSFISEQYKDYVESNKNVRMLPPVFPVLLYNGNAEWTAPTRLSDLIEGREYLGGLSLNFEYHKIAINEYQKEYLLQIKNVVSLLFLAEAHYDADLLQREFLEVFEREEDKGPISLLLNWFIQLRRHGRIPEADMEQLERIYESKEEVRTMLITALEKEKREIYEQGKTDGRNEGKIEGKIEGEIKGEIKRQAEIARKMLLKGLGLPLIVELTGLSEAAVFQLKQEMEN